MALSNNDQERIREYLLGKLSDDEQQKIEERLMVEDDLFEELEISKGELIEEYRAGELSQAEHQWFASHFLASAEGRQRHAFAVALGSLKPPISNPAAVLKRPSFFERLAALFKEQPWALATASAAVLLAALVGIQFYRSAGQTVVGPTLASNFMNRESGAPPTKITLPANASAIKIRLLLSQPSIPSARYQATLDDRTRTRVVEVVENDAESVSVVIPRSQLPRGEYSLTLVAITPDGKEQEIPGDYRFNVE